MPFQKGQSGNPKGRTKGSENSVTKEARNMAHGLVTDREYRRNLQERLRQGKAPHMETLLHHYAYSKPKETVEHQGDVCRRPC